MPKLDIPDWVAETPGPNPLTGVDCGPYAHRALGDPAGLTQFGCHLQRLPPGSRSAQRHWHEVEDELVYVLSGEIVLVEDEETVLRPGDAAGWAAGLPVAHCLENRGTEPAVFLTVGTRAARDVVHYPDEALIMHRDGEDRHFTRTDGTPVERTPT